MIPQIHIMGFCHLQTICKENISVILIGVSICYLLGAVRLKGLNSTFLKLSHTHTHTQ